MAYIAINLQPCVALPHEGSAQFVPYLQWAVRCKWVVLIFPLCTLTSNVTITRECPGQRYMQEQERLCIYETKWPSFLRRHFHVNFLEWKLLNFRYNFIEICSLGSNWQYYSIGSVNGLVPNRWQAIIWSNGGMFSWCIHVSLSLNELSMCVFFFHSTFNRIPIVKQSEDISLITCNITGTISVYWYYRISHGMCFTFFCLYYHFLWNHVIFLPISFKILSLTFGNHGVIEVPITQSWRTWVTISALRMDDIATTKQIITKQYKYVYIYICIYMYIYILGCNLYWHQSQSMCGLRGISKTRMSS